MYHDSVLKNDKLIKVAKFVLLFAGLWPFQSTESKFSLMIHRIYKKFQLIVYSLVILCVVINLFILIIDQSQPTRMFACLHVMVNIGPDSVKIIIYHIKQIPQLCYHIMKHEQEVLTSPDKKVLDYYNTQVRYCNRVNIYRILATLLACVLFGAFAFIKVATAEDMSVFKDEPFMHDMWYPFKREEHMIIVISLSTYALIQGFFYNVSTQTTFICLMIFTSTRLRILQMRIRKFGDIANEKYNGDVLLTIKDLIKEHQELINFVKTLNDKTKYIMLMDFLLNSVNVASGTIQLLTVQSTALIYVLAICMSVLLQIFILAWSANEIQEQSIAVYLAISESNWEDQTEEVKKLLLVMIVRAQSPLGLTAGPFFQMTTKTALKILKIAYSYLSLMLQNYQSKMN